MKCISFSRLGGMPDDDHGPLNGSTERTARKLSFIADHCANDRTHFVQADIMLSRRDLLRTERRRHKRCVEVAPLTIQCHSHRFVFHFAEEGQRSFRIDVFMYVLPRLIHVNALQVLSYKKMVLHCSFSFLGTFPGHLRIISEPFMGQISCHFRHIFFTISGQMSSSSPFPLQTCPQKKRNVKTFLLVTKFKSKRKTTRPLGIENAMRKARFSQSYPRTPNHLPDDRCCKQIGDASVTATHIPLQWKPPDLSQAKNNLSKMDSTRAVPR